MSLPLAAFLLAAKATDTSTGVAVAPDSDDEGGWDGNCRLHLRKRLRGAWARTRAKVRGWRRRDDVVDCVDCECVQGLASIAATAAGRIVNERPKFNRAGSNESTAASSSGSSAAATTASIGGSASSAPPSVVDSDEDGMVDDATLALLEDYLDQLPADEEDQQQQREEEDAVTSVAPPPQDLQESKQPCAHCDAQTQEKDVCAICYDNDDDEFSLLTLCDRGHKYHRDCAVNYLTKMRKDCCPLCHVPETNFLSHCTDKLNMDLTSEDPAAKWLLQHKAQELQRRSNVVASAEEIAVLRELQYEHATPQQIARARQDNTLAQLRRNMARRQQIIATQGATMPPRAEWLTLDGRMTKPYDNDAYFREFKRQVDSMGWQDVVLMAITAAVPLDLAPIEVIREEYAKLARHYNLDGKYNAAAHYDADGERQPHPVEDPVEGPRFEYELVAREGNVVMPYVTVVRNKTEAKARLTKDAQGNTGLVWGSDALDDQEPIFTFCVLKWNQRERTYTVAFNSYDYEHPRRYPFPGGLPNQRFPEFAHWATGRDVTREHKARAARRSGFQVQMMDGRRMDAQWYINVRVSQTIAERRAREAAVAAAATSSSIAPPPAVEA